MWFLRADLAAEVSCLTPELWLMQAVIDLRNPSHPCEHAFLGRQSLLLHSLNMHHHQKKHYDQIRV